MSSGDLRFEFGRNWLRLVRNVVDEERLEIAASSIRELLKVPNLEGKTFLDVGCGSGVFSLGACMLGAKRVVGFDLDADSISASMSLRERTGLSADKWEIMRGSILDEGFLKALAPADIVYAWGVLHHTGRMWQAIQNASRLVKAGGLFCLAIYNKVEKRFGGSRYWHAIKKTYCRSPRVVRFGMESAYASFRVLRILARFRSPLKEASEYRWNRGMSLWHDWVDWLGGYPYEYATAGEVFENVIRLGQLRLITLKTTSGLGNNEFTFLKEDN